jgi:hypothetical protein
LRPGTGHSWQVGPYASGLQGPGNTHQHRCA